MQIYINSYSICKCRASLEHIVAAAKSADSVMTRHRKYRLFYCAQPTLYGLQRHLTSAVEANSLLTSMKIPLPLVWIARFSKMSIWCSPFAIMMRCEKRPQSYYSFNVLPMQILHLVSSAWFCKWNKLDCDLGFWYIMMFDGKHCISIFDNSAI